MPSYELAHPAGDDIVAAGLTADGEVRTVGRSGAVLIWSGERWRRGRRGASLPGPILHESGRAIVAIVGDRIAAVLEGGAVAVVESDGWVRELGPRLSDADLRRVERVELESSGYVAAVVLEGELALLDDSQTRRLPFGGCCAVSRYLAVGDPRDATRFGVVDPCGVEEPSWCALREPIVSFEWLEETLLGVELGSGWITGRVNDDAGRLTVTVGPRAGPRMLAAARAARLEAPFVPHEAPATVRARARALATAGVPLDEGERIVARAGHELLLSIGKGRARLWDLASQAKSREPAHVEPTDANDVPWIQEADGRLLLWTARRLVAFHGDGSQQEVLPAPRPRRIVASDDGGIVAGAVDGVAIVLDASRLELVAELPALEATRVDGGIVTVRTVSGEEQHAIPRDLAWLPYRCFHAVGSTSGDDPVPAPASRAVRVDALEHEIEVAVDAGEEGAAALVLERGAHPIWAGYTHLVMRRKGPLGAALEVFGPLVLDPSWQLEHSSNVRIDADGKAYLDLDVDSSEEYGYSEPIGSGDDGVHVATEEDGEFRDRSSRGEIMRALPFLRELVEALDRSGHLEGELRGLLRERLGGALPGEPGWEAPPDDAPRLPPPEPTNAPFVHAHSVTLAQARKLVATLAADRSVLLLAPPGIGKSEVIGEAAREAGLPLRTLHGSQIGPEDVTGVPRLVGERTVFHPPRVLLPESPEPFALFLDELPSASPEVQRALYPVLLERRIGEFPLPAGTWVVAAGNRHDDRALVRSVSSALLNRLLVLHVKLDVREWLEWAERNHIRREVCAYVRANPEALLREAPSRPEPFSTPRSWTALARAFDAAEAAGVLDDSLAAAIAHGAISPGDAGAFLAARDTGVLDPCGAERFFRDPALLPSGLDARAVVLRALRRAVLDGAVRAEGAEVARLIDAIESADELYVLLQDAVPAWVDAGAAPALLRRLEAV